MHTGIGHNCHKRVYPRSNLPDLPLIDCGSHGRISAGSKQSGLLIPVQCRGAPDTRTITTSTELGSYHPSLFGKKLSAAQGTAYVSGVHNRETFSKRLPRRGYNSSQRIRTTCPWTSRITYTKQLTTGDKKIRNQRKKPKLLLDSIACTNVGITKGTN